MSAITVPEIKSIADLGPLLANMQAASTSALADLSARLLEAEQKSVRPGGAAFAPTKPGQLSPELQKCFDEARGMAEVRAKVDGARCVIDLPDGFFAKASPLVEGVGLGQTDRPNTIVALPMMRFTIRSLLPVVPTTAAVISYIMETGFTNNAAIVAEANAKPLSILNLVMATAPIVTLAHIAKASSQIVEDFPALMQFIDTKLRYGLSLLEEAQLLNGNGVGMNLTGLMTLAPSFADGTVGATRLDAIRRTAADLEEAFFVPTGIVVNPKDWAELELVKSTTGEYLLEQPAGSLPSVVWSLPVVRSPTMPIGSYLVGAFDQAATLYDRWQARVQVAVANEDDWIKNLIAIRAESRIGLAVHTPNALRKGVFV